MTARSTILSKLKSSFETRHAYISAKLGTLVPSQIRALRMKSDMPRQADLARESKMLQSRISVLETPGAANVTLDTLSRIAAAFKVGLIVKFVKFSEMLAWENSFSQDQFDVIKIDKDTEFLSPTLSAQTFQITFAGFPQWESVGATSSGAVFGTKILETHVNQLLPPGAVTEPITQYGQTN